MKAMFVNDDGPVKYATLIARGWKTIETRKKNMLRSLVGERVAIVRTGRGKVPEIIGYVDVVRYEFCPFCLFEMYRDLTCIPQGSKYDVSGRGKWFYHLANAETCDPYPLPADAVRHGRSWCEF